MGVIIILVGGNLQKIFLSPFLGFLNVSLRFILVYNHIFEYVFRSSRSSVTNHSHLLENNKNNDKGKHLNNGSRVQKENSMVCFYNVLKYLFGVFHLVINTKLSLYLPITYGQLPKTSTIGIQYKIMGKRLRIFVG